MVEEECYYVEIVGGVDENTPSTSFLHMLSIALVHMPTFAPIHVPSSSISNVESVHL
jgi:hypothetical protein